jgi:hypothetical protein
MRTRGLRQSVWTLVLLVALAAVAAAADVNGKWKAEFSTPDGTQRVNTFTFKTSGETVTGTVAGTQDETPIKDGKIAGQTMSFTAERPFGTMTYKGAINGDEIKFTVEFGDNKFDMLAKRVK